MKKSLLFWADPRRLTGLTRSCFAGRSLRRKMKRRYWMCFGVAGCQVPMSLNSSNGKWPIGSGSRMRWAFIMEPRRCKQQCSAAESVSATKS
ncbi:hypothetical protein J2736_001603 [Paenibacillus qinlingensis]|uniref:Uncharacterized protein n=1 Tax=Paenibacillus qinlingensis TaxID=1837343 RepID=A0ABU1NSG4_9BACL|nr:hypothetical protein [Paenibacillus qinlingensis]